MDPVTAAGIGLSVTSLALQVFAGCIKGYELFRTMDGMPKAYQHLRVRLQVEQCRLLNWGEKVGLVEEQLESPSQFLRLHRNLIVDVMFEIQKIFRDCVKTQEKYENLVPLQVGESERGFTNSQLSRGRDKFMAKTLRFIEKTPQTKLRLEWAMVRQDSFKSLIEKLIGFNDSIEGFLDRGAIDQLQARQYQTNMVLLQLNSKVDELKELSLAFQVVASTHHAKEELLPVSSKMAQQKEHGSIARLADLKAQEIYRIAHFTPNEISPLGSDTVALTIDGRFRSEALYETRTVWVESKDFTTDESHGALYTDAIRNRVPRLVLLLKSPKPKEFRAPHCIGCFEDRSNNQARFGFVYEKPAEVVQEAKPISLFELLRHKKSSYGHQMPSLTKRMALARIISESLMYLHAVNWLHKSFRSNNLVFFAVTDQDINYMEPTLCGFEYARPDVSEELTDPLPVTADHDSYRHPEAIGSRSKKSYDIYGLGIVLIEIAYWEKIDDILDDLRNPDDERSTRKLLLSEASLQAIESHTGEIYREVVRKCLIGGKELGISEQDETSALVGEAIQMAFSAGIVAALGQLKL